MSPLLQKKLGEYYSEYLITGGMPASVSSWITSHDVDAVEKILDNIIADYERDFIKNEVAVVPVEVKAGKNTRSKSLFEYRKRYHPKISVRTSLEIIEYHFIANREQITDIYSPRLEYSFITDKWDLYKKG